MSKLRIDFISAVPDIYNSVLSSSILKIASEKNKVEYHIHDLHDFAEDKFGHIDDYPYGGGAGMLIKCKPVFECIEKLKQEREYDEIIYLTPEGKKFEQNTANKFSLMKNIIFLSGRYKGIDQRIRDTLITSEISIGDYVLAGGELASLVIAESVVRLIPGVLGDSESALKDTFMEDLLEPPQYTRPADFKGMKVPEVLTRGDHKKIEDWQREKAVEKTKKLRPDLIKK